MRQTCLPPDTVYNYSIMAFALKSLAAQIADHESTLSRLDQTIGSERTLLAAMNDDVAATRAATGLN